MGAGSKLCASVEKIGEQDPVGPRLRSSGEILSMVDLIRLRLRWRHATLCATVWGRVGGSVVSMLDRSVAGRCVSQALRPWRGAGVTE